MPRSRRRHHSRSRSRSRSHSHDRERNVKRRKIDSCEDLHNNSRRSVSSEPEANANDDRAQNTVTQSTQGDEGAAAAVAKPPPKRSPTERQAEKLLQQQRKHEERQREKQERLRKREEERAEKQRRRTEEREAKEAKVKGERAAKEKERELKRQERVVKDEAKRKEREEKDAERQKRIADALEKSREKQKAVELTQKAAVAFSKFFTKASDVGLVACAPAKCATFMPFQLKADMRLPPRRRATIGSEAKERLDEIVCGRDDGDDGHVLYLEQIKAKGATRRCAATWPLEEDAAEAIEVGETIAPIAASKRMKAKFFRFAENRRPAYYGTWRKRSARITGRKPLARDAAFNYDVDSDEEWDEDEEGEDIAGSDDEDKEPDADYEVDNQFFVPHGHLSDDEGNDDDGIGDLERRAMEQLLGNQFEEERKLPTRKLKPRVLGCVWHEPQREHEDESVRSFLQPYAMLTAGVVRLAKRLQLPAAARPSWQLAKEHMPDLLRLLHGNPRQMRQLVAEFAAHLVHKAPDAAVNKACLSKLIRSIAKWRRRAGGGGGWLVNADVKEEYAHLVSLSPHA